MKCLVIFTLLLIITCTTTSCSILMKKAPLRTDGVFQVVGGGDEYKISYYRFVPENKIRMLYKANYNLEDATSLLMSDEYPKEYRYIQGKNDITFFTSNGSVKGHGRVDLDRSGMIKNSTFYPINQSSIPIVSESKQLQKYTLTDDNLNKFHEDTLVYVKEMAPGIFLCQKLNEFYLVNSKGTKLTKGKYEWISTKLSNNLIAFKRDGKFGYLNIHGIEVIPPKYELTKSFNEHWAAVKKDKYWHVLLTSGKELELTNITHIGKFDLKRIVPYRTDPNVWKFWSLDKNAPLKGIITTSYSTVINSDLFQIKTPKGYLAINQQGIIPIKVYYKSLSSISKDRYLITLNSGRKLVIDANGNPISTDIKIGIDRNSPEHLITVKSKSGKGIIDLQGRTIIPPIYDYVSLIGKNSFSIKNRVKQEKKYTNNVWIVKNNKIRPEIYNHVGRNINGFVEASTLDPVKYGILNFETLEWAIPPKYRYIKTPVNGYFIFTDNNSKKGIIDVNEKVILPAECSWIDIYDYFAVCKESRETKSITNLKTNKKLIKGLYIHIYKSNTGWILRSKINS